MPDDKIEIENVNTPGRTQRVDRAKYVAMRSALLAVLPSEAPGLKVADAKDALLPHLPDNLFPQGMTAGWWLKAVQLDLEARRHQTLAPQAGHLTGMVNRLDCQRPCITCTQRPLMSGGATLPARFSARPWSRLGRPISMP